MKHIVYVLIFLVLGATAFSPALAQEAPAPRKMPRTPVNREALGGDHRVAIPASREIEGQALIIDGERLRIGDFDLRLFGVVPPQLSASFGPQARTLLDELTMGQNVACLIRDRDREGRFLATCRNASNTDLALELLRRGLAVTARGSVASTDLGAAYIAAEQAAQAKKAGLWSSVIPAPVAVPDVTKPPLVVGSSPPSAVPASEQAAAKLPEAALATKSDAQPTKPIEPPVMKPKSTTAQITDDLAAADRTVNEDSASQGPGFLARYQLLITGLVMLATALGMLAAISIQRIIERRTEIKAIAAALRGELMAARAVCLGRIKAGDDDKDISWPRIRSTLYQAYVGRLGWLGAELARRVASIYGQASDYAAYYDSNDDRETLMPKRQALQALAQHIDNVLPRLAMIEQTGNRTGPETLAKPMPVNAAAPDQTASERSVVPLMKNQMGVAIKASGTWFRAAIQNLADRRRYKENAASKAQDAIAEYTALIEEEMKRFAFDEGEDGSGLPASNVTPFHGTGT